MLKDRRRLVPFGTVVENARPVDRPWPGHLDGPAPGSCTPAPAGPVRDDGWYASNDLLGFAHYYSWVVPRRHVAAACYRVGRAMAGTPEVVEYPDRFSGKGATDHRGSTGLGVGRVG